MLFGSATGPSAVYVLIGYMCSVVPPFRPSCRVHGAGFYATSGASVADLLQYKCRQAEGEI